LRLVRDGHRDHHALLLAARELVRIGAQARPRLRNPHLGEQLGGPLERLTGRHAAMQPQHLGDLLADAEHRVERAHRLLEHRADVAPAQRAQPCGRRGEQVFAAVIDAAGRIDDGVLGQQAQDRHRRHGLAAAGFADQGERRVVPELEAHAAHRLHAGLPRDKADPQIHDADQRAHRSLGSSASRRLSVSIENAVRKTAMNAVAAASCHHLPITSSVCASESIVPQETMSTGTPSPRNDRITSTLMNATTRSESCTRMTWLTFGRMCTNMREAAEAPIACAASTYSRERCFMYSARTRRYMPVHPVTARMITTVQMPLANNWANAPLRSTAASEKISRIDGIEVNTLCSTARRSLT